MDSFSHDGVVFHFRDRGAGVPLVFQHGLGADGQQTFDILEGLGGARLLTLDTRAHGRTKPIGPIAKISLRQSSEDLAALLDRLSIDVAVVGGISMGAAIAQCFVSRYPAKVAGLILSRPAWLDRPAPPNLRLYGVIADLIRRYGPRQGLVEFLQTPQYRSLTKYPSTAQSLVDQFREARAEEAVARLERIPTDTPIRNRREWRAVEVPALVLACERDPIHPYEYATELAAAIPNVTLCELTPKDVSREDHAADTRRAIANFLDAMQAR